MAKIYTPALGRFVYQTLSSDDFTKFDNEFGHTGCGNTTENPGCHNFHKPNMSAANPEHLEVSVTLTDLWARTSSGSGSGSGSGSVDGGNGTDSTDYCHFVMSAQVPSTTQLPGRAPSDPHGYYGAPSSVWTTVDVRASASAAAAAFSTGASSSDAGVSIDIAVGWLNKTT
jgi:hypothetical protein